MTKKTLNRLLDPLIVISAAVMLWVVIPVWLFVLIPITITY